MENFSEDHFPEVSYTQDCDVIFLRYIVQKKREAIVKVTVTTVYEHNLEILFPENDLLEGKKKEKRTTKKQVISLL